MMVKVEFFDTQKEINLPNGSTVENLLSHLSLLPDTVIVMSNDVVLPSDAPLMNHQKVRIIRVASGG